MVPVAGITLLVVIFTYSSLSKMTRDGFGALRSTLARLGRMASPAGWAVVCVEISVVALLLYPPSRFAGLVLAAIVTGALTAGVALILYRGYRVNGACFGRNQVLLGRRHLLRNVALLVVSIVALVATPAGIARCPEGVAANESQ
jgi:hypothetical protein